jgi:hypothetical protein
MRALCIVRSWLLSWNVPHEIREGRLMVDGKLVDYDTSKVLSLSFDSSLTEVKRLVESCGHTAEKPPRVPTGVRAADDDLLARSMRLTAFSKTPNPPEAVLLKYRPIVKREADRSWRKFAHLNHALLLEPSDYLSVGMVFLTIYLHRYQDLQHESRNGADLTLYLQQEFGRWDKVLHHDLPSIALDIRGMLPEQLMSAPVPGGEVDMWNSWGAPDEDGARHNREPSYTMPEYATEEQEDPDMKSEGNLPHHLLQDLLTAEEYERHVSLCRHCQNDPKAIKSRNRSAKERLSLALGEMEHDTFVESLSDVMANPYLDPDARELAAKHLRKHLGECEGCAAAWTAWEEQHAHHRRYMTTAAKADVHPL